jgi:hypothetical protein
MKKNLINYLLLFSLSVSLFSCTDKFENDFDGFVAGLTNGAYLKGKATFDPATNSWTDQSVLANTLDANNLTAARVGVKVRQWGDPIVTANIYVVKNTDANQANWKFIKKYDVRDTSYFDIFVSAQEIATALGLQMNANTGNFAPGSIFTCYVEVVTADGRKFTANNSNFTNSGANFYYPITSFRASVVCPFTPSQANGTYRVIRDTWDDWGAGDLIPNTVTGAASATFGADTSSFTFRGYPNPAPCGIIPATFPTVKVRTSTGVVVIQNQGYGGYTCFGSFYTNLSITTIGSSNFFFTCTGRLVFSVRHHTPGNFNANGGETTIELQKEP